MKLTQLLVLASSSLILFSCDSFDRFDKYTFSGKMNSSGFSYQDDKNQITLPIGESKIEISSYLDQAHIRVLGTNQNIRLNVGPKGNVTRDGDFKVEGKLGSSKVSIEGKVNLNEEILETRQVDKTCEFKNPNCAGKYCPPGEDRYLSGSRSQKIQTVRQTRTVQAQVFHEGTGIMDLDAGNVTVTEKIVVSTECSKEKHDLGNNDPLPPIDQMTPLNLGKYWVSKVISGRQGWRPTSYFDISANDFTGGVVAKDTEGYVLKFKYCDVSYRRQVVCYREDARSQDSIRVIDSDTFILKRVWPDHPTLEVIYKREI